MSHTKTTPTETAWARYRHREKPEIEYDVEIFASNRSLIVHTKPMTEPCFRIRTIKNHFKEEEIHQPAYTYMPTEEFTEIYERVV